MERTHSEPFLREDDHESGDTKRVPFVFGRSPQPVSNPAYLQTWTKRLDTVYQCGTMVYMMNDTKRFNEIRNGLTELCEQKGTKPISVIATYDTVVIEFSTLVEAGLFKSWMAQIDWTFKIIEPANHNDPWLCGWLNEK